MALNKRNSFQIARDTINALLMRELKTRFGVSKLGYFWAVVEPVAQVAILAILFTLIGRNSVSGVPVALFLVSGVMPFKAFGKTLTQLSSAIFSNKALLAYRQVSPIDPILTRLIIEVATFFIVYVIILLSMLWLGFDVWPQNLLGLIFASLLLILLAFGLALCVTCGSLYWGDAGKIVALIMRPMFFISGIFYCATMIPAKYWYLFSWNPVFHAIELSRASFFYNYETPIGSWNYLTLITLCFVTFGLMLYRINRQKFVSI